MISIKFAQRFKSIREDYEPFQNQSQLGKAIGMSQRKISFMETGRSEPSLQDLAEICNYYNLSADYLLGLSDEPRQLK